MVSERLTLSGDLLDRNLLATVFDDLSANGVAFRVRRFAVGEFTESPSIIELRLTAPDVPTLRRALAACEAHGASFSLRDAELAPADLDGVLPEGFHSTTNFPTQVLAEGQPVEVENLEMDCGIRVWRENERWRAATCPMHRVRVGDLLVVGHDGVLIEPSEELAEDDTEFRFMANDVSTERPKARIIAEAAAAMRRSRAAGRKTLFVGGPAIIHSGSGPLLARLVEGGWVDVLFAGNALAAHDIESNLLGTSLGVDLATGRSGPHGHTHHLRAINRIRRAGSIAAAVESGEITGGVMWSCVKFGVPFVLCGSIRDDGPLPDVVTDAVAAQDRMREHVGGAGVCLMVATTLHSVAVGNLLPASVVTFCVDSDADTVIKLTDRGTHQAQGIVTDCEYFLSKLASELEV